MTPAWLGPLFAVGVLWPCWSARRSHTTPWLLWVVSDIGLALDGWDGAAAWLGILVLMDTAVQGQLEDTRPATPAAALAIPAGLAVVTFAHQSPWLFVLGMLYPLRLAEMPSRQRIAWGWAGICLAVLVLTHHAWLGGLAATVLLGSRQVQRQLEATAAPWLPLAWVGILTLVCVPAHLPGLQGLLLFWVLFPLWRPRSVDESVPLWAAWVACLGLFATDVSAAGAMVLAPMVLAGRAIQRQLELDASKRDFASMVSHELRTPIAAVRLHAEMLENHLVTDPAEVEACYRTLGEQARRLQHLTETILDLSRLERGVRVFQQVPGNLNEVVQEAVAQAGASEVALELRPDIPPVPLDREAAIQVVVNLLQNAHRYAKDVSVATGFDRRWAWVAVQDRGPGIPRHQRARVFEPYVRGRSEGKGLGLGLALVRRYVEGQRGRVSIDDRRGGGCVVTARFRRLSGLSG